MSRMLLHGITLKKTKFWPVWYNHQSKIIPLPTVPWGDQLPVGVLYTLLTGSCSPHGTVVVICSCSCLLNYYIILYYSITPYRWSTHIYFLHTLLWFLWQRCLCIVLLYIIMTKADTSEIWSTKDLKNVKYCNFWTDFLGDTSFQQLQISLT